MAINTIIISVFNNIFFVLLGVLATVVAALMAKTYILNYGNKLDNIINPSPTVKALQNIFDVFRIPNFHLIKISFNATFIDSENGIVIVVPESGFEFSGLVPHGTDDHDSVDFTYQLPQMTKSKSVPNAKIGWRKLFEYEGNTYALTLISLEPYETVAFDFRKVTKTIKPVD